MKKEGKFTIGFFSILLLLIACFYFYYTVRENKFGKNFNYRRQALHIPIIPEYWKIKKSDCDMTWWMGAEITIGHEGKRVIYSKFGIDEEIDDYFFSNQQTQERTLQIRYKYINSFRAKDSIIFTYQIGHLVKSLTPEQADSIFKVYRIKKDY